MIVNVIAGQHVEGIKVDDELRERLFPDATEEEVVQQVRDSVRRSWLPLLMALKEGMTISEAFNYVITHTTEVN